MTRHALLLACLVLVGCAAERPLPAAPPEGTGERVTRVVDGDTLHVDRNGKDVTVRLLRVNTTERGQWGYSQGGQQLRRLTQGKSVRLEFEDERKDRYGRELAYVFVGDTNVNVEVVRSGWSKFFTRYGRGKYAEDFVRAEQEARRERRGLWSRD